MNILGIAGWKNSGKTTLVRSLITELTNRNIRVSTLKHAHHDFDIDQPGTDSYKHRKAGAQEVLIVSPRRWALIHEETEVSKPDLTTMLGKLEDTDLVLVEGFKSLSFPKLEIRREDSSGPDLAP
ncbi:MAG: molybdopterin-guanine dinucleotide biosynthesis protein B, partial [Rhodobacteraceae bacterium]|nr:molybdopterin-guanine dinucleotide biosynthesis protein B [Paracoccaceae bacterium]